MKQQQSTPDSPLFSIVVPTYNRPEMLSRALKSIFRQSFTNYEVIVVDDGSNVSYQQTLIEYKDKITFCVNNDGQGAASARNYGVTLAQGQWIAFLDDDDEFHHEYLANLSARLKEATTDIGFAWSSILKKIANADGSVTETPVHYKESYRNKGQLYTMAACIGCGYGFAVKRDCFDQVGGFDTNFKVAEDTDFILKLLSAGVEPLVCKDIGVIVHHHMQDRLTPDFTEHANTRVYERITDKHQDFIVKHPQLTAIFLGWSANVYYMVGMPERGRAMTRRMLQLNRFHPFVWLAYGWVSFTRLSLKFSSVGR